MMYVAEYVDSVKKDIKKLSEKNKNRIKFNIENKLLVNPFIHSKPLRYSLKGNRSMRVGDYRVILKIESENKILIVQIIHRKEAYS